MEEVTNETYIMVFRKLLRLLSGTNETILDVGRNVNRKSREGSHHIILYSNFVNCLRYSSKPHIK